MRVALISEHASPLAALGGPDAGGQNTHVAEVSAALADAGHDVRVYTRRDSAAQPAAVAMCEGVTVLHVPAGPAEQVPKDSLLPYMDPFGRWLAGHWLGGVWSPDVVHAHFWMSGLAALTARKHTGVPVVHTYHALGVVKRRHLGGADTSPPGRVTAERAIGREVDRVVAQCRDEMNELVRMGLRAGHIAVIPSGVNERVFRPDGPAVPRAPDRARVLAVARLVERKGLQDVVRAVAPIPDVECVVIGGPPAERLDTDPLARRLRRLADWHGVGDRVRLVGAVPRQEMPLWYRSADVLVAAPWYEPFGLTPLEAMACGVPVVGTAVGGLTDTILDGVTGDLVPPRNPAALSRALRRLLQDPALRMEYSTAGVDRVRGEYGWRLAATRLTALYAGVAGTVASPVGTAVAS